MELDEDWVYDTARDITCVGEDVLSGLHPEAKKAVLKDVLYWVNRQIESLE